MPKRKIVPFVREREKINWHPYGLQSLAPQRFQRVVQNIINGRYSLLPTGEERTNRR